MAVDAAHVVLQVYGSREIALFMPGGVALEAAGAALLRGYTFEGEDFAYVAASIHVGAARAVAILATVPGDASFCLDLLPVARAFPGLVFIRVAGLAGVCANVR